MISQEQANKILDAASERVVNNDPNPLRKLIKKMIMHKVMETITQDCAIIGHEAVFETYRAAIDAMELLVSENLKSEKEGK